MRRKIKFFKSILKIIFLAPARKTSLMIGWVTSKELNITCEAKDIYPEPNITIKIDGLHFANERYVDLVLLFRNHLNGQITFIFRDKVTVKTIESLKG